MANIVISGLTAAGKTTHCALLAEDLGYEVVSVTKIMAELCGLPYENSGRDFWVKYKDRVEQVRKSGDLDRAIDKKLIELAQTSDNLIFDSWALPWLVPHSSNLVSVWLESDIESRTRKAFVSQVKKTLSLDECRTLITEKDLYSKNVFQKLYDFNLFTDHDVFTLKLDNSHLIPEPTEASAVEGIAAFRPVLLEEVRKYLVKN